VVGREKLRWKDLRWSVGPAYEIIKGCQDELPPAWEWLGSLRDFFIYVGDLLLVKSLLPYQN
jgi:hypothetical protein